uniref:Uncharacterized protein n=1 Tax=Rhizophora mucronata TaxID=61149 RepID=A0A2P2NXV7_RHIMU
MYKDTNVEMVVVK